MDRFRGSLTDARRCVRTLTARKSRKVEAVRDEQPRLTKVHLFEVFPPPSPHDIVVNYSLYLEQIKTVNYATEYDKDTPLHALYRLYEYVMLDQNIGMRNEIENFWLQPAWKVNAIPDPQDEDPARYAVLACITSLLVIAFNNKLQLGAPRDGRSLRSNEEIWALQQRKDRDWETAPDWAAPVPRLHNALVIPAHDGTVLPDFDDPRASKAFKEKNILIWEPHILFV